MRIEFSSLVRSPRTYFPGPTRYYSFFRPFPLSSFRCFSKFVVRFDILRELVQTGRLSWTPNPTQSFLLFPRTNALASNYFLVQLYRRDPRVSTFSAVPSLLKPLHLLFNILKTFRSLGVRGLIIPGKAQRRTIGTQGLTSIIRPE